MSVRRLGRPAGVKTFENSKFKKNKTETVVSKKEGYLSAMNTSQLSQFSTGTDASSASGSAYNSYPGHGASSGYPGLNSAPGSTHNAHHGLGASSASGSTQSAFLGLGGGKVITPSINPATEEGKYGIGLALKFIPNRGYEVISVCSGSSSEKAGIANGDILLSADQKTIMQGLRPLDILGEKNTSTQLFFEKKGSIEVARGGPPLDPRGVRLDGLLGLSVSFIQGKVLVAHVAGNSPAFREGLQMGDCIVSMNGQPCDPVFSLLSLPISHTFFFSGQIDRSRAGRVQSCSYDPTGRHLTSQALDFDKSGCWVRVEAKTISKRRYGC